MPSDPIVTMTGLPSGPCTVRPSASAYLRPSWKMWPISMPRAISSSSPSGAEVAGEHLGDVDDAVGGEVASGDQADDVAAGASAPVTQRVPVTTRGSTR